MDMQLKRSECCNKCAHQVKRTSKQQRKIVLMLMFAATTNQQKMHSVGDKSARDVLISNRIDVHADVVVAHHPL
jgi:hypothetical protein